MQSELDNEFDLVFIVGYQNFLQLTYIDKLLSEVKKRFRDMYKNRLQVKTEMWMKILHILFRRESLAMLKPILKDLTRFSKKL